MYTLNITESFKNDLKSTVDYIKQNFQAPIAAQRLKNQVKMTYKKIKNNPLIYPIVHDEYLASLGYRFVVIKNFMLFYKVNKNIIEVMRFLYGPSDWSNKLKDDI